MGCGTHHPASLRACPKSVDTPIPIGPTLRSNPGTPTGAKKQGGHRCLLGNSTHLCQGGAGSQHSGFLQENLQDGRAH
ncbi:hypothetical protein NDU88_006552 [Pleurodeles waltl]|uniref:Uncharacterized protein n=1 Tax=Pleurodeles waltl TaxID=8319 RepID=A0AAV7PR12_PLEWA|nr:hypothetical protein NDU88_006552 [Pleurodeles waltl]